MRRTDRIIQVFDRQRQPGCQRCTNGRPQYHLGKPVLADRLISRSLATDIALVLTGAVVVGALAQAEIPMFPVPVTGQTLAVLLVGGSLGMRRGAASLFTYLVVGVAGVPWFADFTGGPAALLKPSFGSKF